jgi:hypothetical protein
MGERGPIPKRSTERIRTNKESRPETVTVVAGKARRPAALKTWHPHARAWYESLARSVSKDYFEPSDWAFAVCLADIYSLGLTTANAAMIGQFIAGTARLLTTEADRRRNRLEVQRGKPEASDEGPLPAPKLVVSNG